MLCTICRSYGHYESFHWWVHTAHGTQCVQDRNVVYYGPVADAEYVTRTNGGRACIFNFVFFSFKYIFIDNNYVLFVCRSEVHAEVVLVNWAMKFIGHGFCLPKTHRSRFSFSERLFEILSFFVRLLLLLRHVHLADDLEIEMKTIWSGIAVIAIYRWHCSLSPVPTNIGNLLTQKKKFCAIGMAQSLELLCVCAFVNDILATDEARATINEKTSCIPSSRFR